MTDETTSLYLLTRITTSGDLSADAILYLCNDPDGSPVDNGVPLTVLQAFMKATAAQVLAGTDDIQFLTPLTAKSLPSTLIDSTPDADHLAHGTKTTFTANENQAFGDVCYIDSDGEAHLGDADAEATSRIIAMCIDASVSAGEVGNYLLLGIARDDTWNWTVGGFVYLSTTGTTGNTLTQTAPSGADDAIVVLGVATHADRIYFNPQLVIVEHT